MYDQERAYLHYPASQIYMDLVKAYLFQVFGSLYIFHFLSHFRFCVLQQRRKLCPHCRSDSPRRARASRSHVHITRAQFELTVFVSQNFRGKENFVCFIFLPCKIIIICKWFTIPSILYTSRVLCTRMNVLLYRNSVFLSRINGFELCIPKKAQGTLKHNMQRGALKLTKKTIGLPSHPENR